MIMKINTYFFPFALFFFLQLCSTSLATFRLHKQCPPCPICPPCPCASSDKTWTTPSDDSTSTIPSDDSTLTPPSGSTSEPPSSPKPSKSTPPTPSSQVPPTSPLAPSSSSSQNPPNSSPPSSSSSQNPPTTSPPTSSSSKSPPISPSQSQQSPPTSSSSSSGTSPPTSSSSQTPPTTSSGKSPPVSPSGQIPPTSSSGQTPPTVGQTPPTASSSSSGQSPPTSSPPPSDKSPLTTGQTPPTATSSSGQSPPTSSLPTSGQSSPTASSGQSPPTASSGQSPPTASSGQSPPTASSGQTPPTASSSSSGKFPPTSTPSASGQSPPSSGKFPPTSTPSASGQSPPSSSQSPSTPSSGQSPPTSSSAFSGQSPPSSSQSSSTPSSSQSPSTSSSDQSPPTSSSTSLGQSPPTSTPPSSTQTPSSQSPNSPSVPSLGFTFKGCFSKVFAFGGSYTDTGNAQAMGALSQSFFGANSPYGGTGFGKPANRLCDGRLVLDFLCDSLSLPPPQPYKSVGANFSTGVNFALAGSTSLSSDFFAKYKIGQNLVWKMHMSMKMQIDWFNTYYQQEICKGQNPKSCKPDFENTLFWIGEMGVNDYSRSFKTSIPMQMLTDSCILHVTQLLMTLLQNGAKYIVVQGLPPVGCLASDVSVCPLQNLDKMGCVNIINSAIMMHNQILQKKIEGFQKQYPDRAIVYGDYWNAYMTILQNPQKYQMEEPFKACCGVQNGPLNFNQHSFCGFPGTTTCTDPSKYVNWDGIHLTEAMYKHVTKLLLHEGFCQPSFDTLVKKKLGS